MHAVMMTCLVYDVLLVGIAWLGREVWLSKKKKRNQAGTLLLRKCKASYPHRTEQTNTDGRSPPAPRQTSLQSNVPMKRVSQPIQDRTGARRPVTAGTLQKLWLSGSHAGVMPHASLRRPRCNVQTWRDAAD